MCHQEPNTQCLTDLNLWNQYKPYFNANLNAYKHISDPVTIVSNNATIIIGYPSSLRLEKS